MSMRRKLAQIAAIAMMLAGPSAVIAQSARDSAPPAGLLTPLEARRHQGFVEPGRNADIDMLFIGDSAMDFWRYDWGGKLAWDANYAGRKTANLGVEGAHTKSVLWRLQHGELDGVKAKVVVIGDLFAADMASHHLSLDDVLAGNAAILAEVRKRQPEARIVLVTIPRGMDPASEGGRYARAVAAQFATQADGKQIRFLDLRKALITPEGAIDGRFMSGRGSALNAAGYAAWAQAMTPTIDALLR
jgi:beta-glucosidase